jgi:succinate-semialdehyde dehydrogenase/glutarate-semialdehyde dehydrogenase
LVLLRSSFPPKTKLKRSRLQTIHRLGSGGWVYSTDLERAKRVASSIETGTVFINYPDVSWPDLPSGGIKRSGYGKELSNLGLEEFVNKQLVLVPNIPGENK